MSHFPTALHKPPQLPKTPPLHKLNGAVKTPSPIALPSKYGTYREMIDNMSLQMNFITANIKTVYGFNGGFIRALMLQNDKLTKNVLNAFEACKLSPPMPLLIDDQTVEDGARIMLNDLDIKIIVGQHNTFKYIKTAPAYAWGHVSTKARGRITREERLEILKNIAPQYEELLAQRMLILKRTAQSVQPNSGNALSPLIPVKLEHRFLTA